MQDRELYAKILGIEHPWYVSDVTLRLKDGEVDIFLEHDADMRWPCPQCGADCALYDHQPQRRWRHLDTCQFRTDHSCKPAA